MFYIDNGTAVNASWTNVIAISRDGSNWTPINKEMLNVKPRWINNASSPRAPFLNKGSYGVITLRVDNSEILAEFDPSDALNSSGVAHTGWAGTQVGLQKAVVDVASWL
tara:strand:+ start:1548 stop:1874 length:327 start_codon:yes stop_codon:yes gene_type:complete